MGEGVVAQSKSTKINQNEVELSCCLLIYAWPEPRRWTYYDNYPRNFRLRRICPKPNARNPASLYARLPFLSDVPNLTYSLRHQGSAGCASFDVDYTSPSLPAYAIPPAFRPLSSLMVNLQNIDCVLFEHVPSVPLIPNFKKC